MRKPIFITHAAPEDNDFALWLSSKLATAGYRAWVDKQRLRSGDDFWDEIDHILNSEAVKQIVVFTKHCTKDGVKRQLAIGSSVAQLVSDPKFMIPIRADDVRFSDAPPEFIPFGVPFHRPDLVRFFGISETFLGRFGTVSIFRKIAKTL